jgi:hypothetical protein
MAAPHQDQHRRWSANFWHGSSEVLTMSDAAREIIVLTKNDGEPANYGELCRWSLTTGHATEILDEYDPYLGYDAEKFPLLSALESRAVRFPLFSGGCRCAPRTFSA